MAVGIACYCIYQKYDFYERARPTLGFFVGCMLTSPFHIILIPLLILFNYVNNKLGIKPYMRQNYIGKLYRVIDQYSMQHRGLTPIKNENVIRITTVESNTSEEFARVLVTRVDSLSNGEDTYASGSTYLEDMKKGIKSGGLVEVSEDEKILSLIK
tara:strand:- start:1201 stop:1668 length:468 start_codon:yes stop_codon:yes gene_type:complete